MEEKRKQADAKPVSKHEFQRNDPCSLEVSFNHLPVHQPGGGLLLPEDLQLTLSVTYFKSLLKTYFLSFL